MQSSGTPWEDNRRSSERLIVCAFVPVSDPFWFLWVVEASLLVVGGVEVLLDLEDDMLLEGLSGRGRRGVCGGVTALSCSNAVIFASAFNLGLSSATPSTAVGAVVSSATSTSVDCETSFFSGVAIWLLSTSFASSTFTPVFAVFGLFLMDVYGCTDIGLQDGP